MWIFTYLCNVHMILISAPFDAQESADLSTLFDVGGILGGIGAGVFSDYTGARALSCAIMLICAAPMVSNVYLCICFFSVHHLHLCFHPSVCPFIHPSTHPPTHPPTHPSIHLPILQSIYPSIHPIVSTVLRDKPNDYNTKTTSSPSDL